MARPVTTGTHVVPKEISNLKPKGISCDIKVIVTSSTTRGTQKHYYVYESRRTGSGKVIGKIEGGKFIPNHRGVELFQKLNKETKSLDSDKKEEVDIQTQDMDPKPVSSSLSEAELDAVKGVAVNLNLDIDQIALQLKDYGEYAMVLSSTSEVLYRLEKYFSDNDSRLIYALSIIYFVQEYTPASYVKDVYDSSILSNKWPTLAISENMVGSFLESLGRHPAICDKYCQGLIDESTGLTAIDGHVILTCSKQNDLADYGNKYQKISNKQLNVLQAYDAINKVPLTSTAYEGGVVDKISVQDLLSSFRFPSRTVFLVDMGFYSEEDLGLYREGGKHFIIPVPDSTIISKAMRSCIIFSDSFAYEKTDENGLTHKDTILYRESTVKGLEDIYQTILDESVKQKNKEAEEACPPGKKPKKYPRKQVTRSAYGNDRVIMFRDEDMHNKMVAEYRSQIGSDDEHTEEKLTKLGPAFGLIIMRTNLESDKADPSVVYCDYKKRWTIETHYNFVENTIKYSGLKTSNYCSMQGLSFLMITVGQIKSYFVKKMASSKSQYVRTMSIKESLTKAACFKLVQNQDKVWRISMASRKKTELLQEMGVDVAGDIKKLNISQL